MTKNQAESRIQLIKGYFMKSLILAISLFVAACAGHSAPLPTILVHAEGTTASASSEGFAAQILISDEEDARARIAIQCKLEGAPVIAGIGKANQATIDNFWISLEAARLCPKIVGVYLFDEYGWGKEGFSQGKFEKEICAGAKAVRAVGLLSTMTILPDALLRGDFTLGCVNDFDILAIDVYPSIQASQPDFAALGCSLGSNRSLNMVHCSVQKLRNKLGFKGRIVYIYQAFCLTVETEENCRAGLLEQRLAIDNAALLGIDGLSPWGLDLSEKQERNEPLRHLRGTPLEYLVRPPQ